ncbi:hypothetical protein NONO_c21690 [Nocardia nova SH22a]|uniref:Secreted protein n=1 Tax=Nocardia nova SH22a TaxID=1415166 RepID=W5TCJ3_9NOCA|nr:hypothetical protein [Nocardia nova]AHH16967.1 hypothetical protein NONO_c21690 [Nocardia nova SH22a]
MSRNPRISLTFPALAALAVAGMGLTAAPAEAEERRPTTSATKCLWAGTGHATGTTVVAGGRDYRCAADASGTPMWSAEALSHRADTVANPGAAAAPAGAFSLGARQPGTAYTDYCVGNQLVEGTGDVYQVVRANDGTLFWRAAEPIEAWHFDRGTAAPQSTWRSSALCYEGNLA